MGLLGAGEDTDHPMLRRSAMALRLREKPLEGVLHGYSLGSKWWNKALDLAAEWPERILLWPFYGRLPIDRPVFIAGAFRSGTTILEQIITAHDRVGHFSYFTNIDTRAPVSIYLSLRAFQALGVLDREPIPAIHNPRIPFTLYAPYECETIWNHSDTSQWDDACTDLTLGPDGSQPRFERYLRSVIRRHLFIQGADRFVNKNPVHSLRLPYLNRLFPDLRALFVVRTPLDTVLSHYRAAAHMQSVIYPDPRIRRMFQHDLHIDMLSEKIKTRDYARTLRLWGEHPLLGIAEQWQALNSTALDHLAAYPSLAARVRQVRYEDLVSSPERVLADVWRFVELSDSLAAEISARYAERLAPPQRRTLTLAERTLLPRVAEIVAPVAARLGYAPDEMHDWV
jgi:hypothetical protein